MNLKPIVFFFRKNAANYWELTSVLESQEYTKSPDHCVAVIIYVIWKWVKLEVHFVRLFIRV